MAGGYSDAELQQLDAVGQRRTAVALVDIRQCHLSEYGGQQ